MHVTALERYKLALEFSDQTSGLLDVSSLAGKGVFSSWDADDLFFRPYVSETGAIAWNDDLDLDPLKAYLTIRGLSFEEWMVNQKNHASD